MRDSFLNVYSTRSLLSVWNWGSETSTSRYLPGVMSRSHSLYIDIPIYFWSVGCKHLRTIRASLFENSLTKRSNFIYSTRVLRIFFDSFRLDGAAKDSDSDLRVTYIKLLSCNSTSFFGKHTTSRSLPVMQSIMGYLYSENLKWSNTSSLSFLLEQLFYIDVSYAPTSFRSANIIALPYSINFFCRTISPFIMLPINLH